MTKKLLILTAPQGAGNHMFSKIFASSNEIGGWGSLLDNYWLGHHTEPFNTIWAGERSLEKKDFDGYQYWVTSISIPYVRQGQLEIPDVLGFQQQAEDLGVSVKVGVVARDINILEAQQSRVRGESTIDLFMSQFQKFQTPVFLSHESVTLYGQPYMNWFCDTIGFPHCKIPKMEDANKKYVAYVKQSELDLDVHKAAEESKTQILR